MSSDEVYHSIEEIKEASSPALIILAKLIARRYSREQLAENNKTEGNGLQNEVINSESGDEDISRNLPC